MKTAGLWAEQKRLTYFKKEYVTDNFLTEEECISLLKENKKMDFLKIYSFKNCLLTKNDFEILFLNKD